MKLKNRSLDFKYLQVADAIEKLIQEEAIAIGDKLPSVRILSEEYGISFGTALQCYYHLESKGLVESRPKSGYYVRFNNRRLPTAPSVLQQPYIANEVSVENMVETVFKNTKTKGFIDISKSTPDISLLPIAKLNKSVQWVLRNSTEQTLQYENVQGNSELRSQLTKLCFNWGAKFRSDDIIVTAGCVEAIVLCLKAVTNPGDTVAIESPTYFGIFQITQILGLKVMEIASDPVTGVDLDDLEWKIKRFKIKACVFIPNFNNPLGSCMPDEKKRQLVELVTKYAVPLIEDDIYGDMYFGKTRPKTCKSFDKEGIVLYCSSFSKTVAAGYRIGWCIPGRYMQRIKTLKTMTTLSGTPLTQMAVAHFLSIGRYEYHLKKLRRTLYTQCLRYQQAIITHFPSDVKISRPQGGFVLWIELSRRVSSTKLYTEAIKYGISLAPGEFFSPVGHYSNCIRVGYGKPYDKHVDYGLHVVGSIIKKLLK